MDGSEEKFLMQKINGAMHIICHLMNHYHHHRHLHHYINHSSLALNPHCMTFLCIIVLDVGCSWPHWGKCPLCSSVKSVWQVIFLRSFLDCIKARYKPSTVTGSRRRSNTLLWVNNYQMIGPQRAFEWMNLLKITSLSRVWVWMLSLRRNGSTSLTNENEKEDVSVTYRWTDNAQLTGGIWFVCEIWL